MGVTTGSSSVVDHDTLGSTSRELESTCVARLSRACPSPTRGAARMAPLER